MEKRVVLFLLLSLAIIFGYDFLLKQLGVIPPSDESVSESPFVQDNGESITGEESKGPEIGKEQFRSEESFAAAPASTGEKIEEKIEVVQTPLLQARLTNRGAEIQSWTLNHYQTQNSDDPQPVELIYPEGHFDGPLAIKVQDSEVTKVLQESLYEVDRDFEVLDADHPVGHITFTHQNPDHGIWVRKKLTFHFDSYLVDVEVATEGLAQGVDVVLGTNFGVVEWGQGFIGMLGAAWMIGDTLEKEAPEPEITRTGDVRWAALQDKYFISVLIPQGAEGVTAKTEAERVVSTSVQFPKSESSAPFSFQLYAGPKQFDILKSFQIGLEDTIDFGWFIYGSWAVVKAVAKPLFYVLRFLYDYTQNYGVAIILLTCGIKLLFVPLQYKSYKSMQGMQKVQPKVVALQAKFKDDREKLNKELMKLYKEHKVNPVGGCLPMVLQMPAFISLFNILYMTVDLRQAPFVLWITDLSVQDPFYVLPVLMGASMVLQQKIMPTTMDPAQAKMMLILPVVLTFLFVTFPAGLVLYWLTNNCLTILQQFVTDRYIFKKPTFTQEAPAQVESKESNSEGKKKRGKGSDKNS